MLTKSEVITVANIQIGWKAILWSKFDDFQEVIVLPHLFPLGWPKSEANFKHEKFLWDQANSWSLSSGVFSMGSMGSAEPINFEKRVLEPINF